VSAVGDVDRRRAIPAVGGVRYDALVAVLCAVFLGGAYLDVWAHVHVPELETFFTPWHAVFYAGFFAIAAVTVAPLLRRRVPGMPWSRALPDGYDLSVIGILVFALGGLLDMLWHIVFGIEADVEALLSPSHLVLAVGSALILTGPLRAAWRRHDAVASWPAIVSLGLLLSVFSFFTQYAHHFGRPWPAAGNRPTAQVFATVAPDPVFRNAEIQNLYVAHGFGVAAVLLQAALIAAIALLAVRRWGPRLPAGAFTVVFGMNALLIGAARDQLHLLPGAVAAGIVADVMLRVLSPSSARTRSVRWFALAVPASYFALYFVNVALTRGVWWSVPLWSGAIVLAGTVGWLASWLVAPPTIPARAAADAPRETHAAQRHPVSY
jgi:hypothetical protein